MFARDVCSVCAMCVVCVFIFSDRNAFLFSKTEMLIAGRAGLCRRWGSKRVQRCREYKKTKNVPCVLSARLNNLNVCIALACRGVVWMHTI